MFLVVSIKGESAIVLSGQRPGMRLNMLDCTGQPPTTITKNYPSQNVNSTKVEKTCSTYVFFLQRSLTSTTISILTTLKSTYFCYFPNSILLLLIAWLLHGKFNYSMTKIDLLHLLYSDRDRRPHHLEFLKL